MSFAAAQAGLYVLDPKGKKLGRIVHGYQNTANVAFGGDDWKTVFFLHPHEPRLLQGEDSWRTSACREEIVTGIGGARLSWRKPSGLALPGKRVADVPLVHWTIGT